jgi:hypothetical protein
MQSHPSPVVRGTKGILKLEFRALSAFETTGPQQQPRREGAEQRGRDAMPDAKVHAWQSRKYTYHQTPATGSFATQMRSPSSFVSSCAVATARLNPGNAGQCCFRVGGQDAAQEIPRSVQRTPPAEASTTPTLHREPASPRVTTTFVQENASRPRTAAGDVGAGQVTRGPVGTLRVTATSGWFFSRNTFTLSVQAHDSRTSTCVFVLHSSALAGYFFVGAFQRGL